jgi:hypothetical protein
VNFTTSLHSTPNTSFLIQFYRSTNCDDSGFGEGESVFGGAGTATTDAAGNWMTNVVVGLPPGAVITATATNQDTGDTSEFSQCVTVIDPAEGTLALSSPTYNTSEGPPGFVTITVNRTGGSYGPASVQYTTAPGSATAPADYATTAGTLNWADGDDAPKSFDVPIVDDPDVEGAETFTVVLSGATGATLGSPSTATVTIAASDAVIAGVPTASEWALMLLAAMLAVGGVIVMRRS